MDPELEAMGKIYDAISSLEKEQQERILTWVTAKLDLLEQKVTLQKTEEALTTATDSTGNTLSFYTTLVDAFSVAEFNNEKDKVLFVAAYTQIHDEKEDLTSREINSQLKHLGHGISNITRALEGLKGTKPQLVIQTRKDGTSKQAQKKYKVTVEGIKYATALLA